MNIAVTYLVNKQLKILIIHYSIRMEKLLMRKHAKELLKTGKYWILFGKRNINGLAMFWVLRHDWLAWSRGRQRGKQTRGRRRIQMLHDLANDDG